MNVLKSFKSDPVNWMMFIPPNPPRYNETLPNFFWIPKMKKTNPIPCVLYHPPIKKPLPYLMIYCHGNAMDLGDCRYILRDIALNLGIYCVAFDYSGYGLTRDRGEAPSEYSSSRDAIAVYEYMRNEMEWPADRIIIYGQSIGTGIASTIALHAQKKGEPVMALFLQSGYTSIRDVAKAFVGLPGTFILNRFNTREKLKQLTIPILWTHGDIDDVIPYEMSKIMSDEYKGHTITNFHTASGKGHNDMCISADLAIPFSEMISRIEKQREEEGLVIPPHPEKFDPFRKE